MPLHKSQAVVLRKIDFTNTSRIYTLLDDTGNRISVLAKGVRRLKNNFGCCPDYFDILEIVWLEKATAELGDVWECEIIESFPRLRRQIGAFYYSAQIARLLFHATHPGDRAPALFEFSKNALRTFNQGESLPLVYLATLLSLLNLLGFAPEFSRCAECAAPLDSANTALFAPKAGGLLCRACRATGDFGGVVISAGSLAIIRALSRQPLSASVRLGLSPRNLHEIGSVLSKHASYHLNLELPEPVF